MSSQFIHIAVKVISYGWEERFRIKSWSGVVSHSKFSSEEEAFNYARKKCEDEFYNDMHAEDPNNMSTLDFEVISYTSKSND